MIITVTPNPSIDRTQALAGPLTVGGVNRVRHGTDQAGGKGVNVAGVIHHAGEDVLSVVPAPDTGTFARLLTAGGVPTRFTGDAPARVNVTLTDTDGVTTKINSPGPPGTDGAGLADALDALVAEAADTTAAAAADRWLVLAGSLPPDYPADWYARVTAAAHRRGLRVAVDTSDEPLAALVTHAAEDPAAVPDLVKPNSHELAQIVAAFGGTSPDGDALEAAAAAGDLSGVVAAASGLTGRGFGAVLVSLGAAGALLVEDGAAWFCAGPTVEVVSTVGAGDSTLAGYLLGAVRRLAPADRLALAVAHGTTAVTLPGTTLPTPTDLPTTLPVPVRVPQSPED
ncbi:1-phosphofructokinase family hexose kinase [Corynebacterium nuruki]|uniref:1-phosphofructokinase family hexose kinase n=1 Tax=Corynebacterium nuruki TaxID=1032851 RepID=UPI0039BF2760